LRFYGQNGQSKFDRNYPQDYKIFKVKMVNPIDLIMTISPIPDIFVAEIVKIC
jgi:hypothetical protein